MSQTSYKPFPSPLHTRRLPFWHRLGIGVIIVLVLLTSFLTTSHGGVYAKGMSKHPIYTGKRNTYHPTPNQTASLNSQRPGPRPVISAALPIGVNTQIQHPFIPSMKPLTLSLTATSAAHAISSDGRLEISVPAGAVTAGDLAAAPGKRLQLAVYQIAPPSGSTDGNLISFGMYLLQVQDGLGHELASGAGLRQKVTLTYHYPSKRSSIPLDHVLLDLNGALPVKLPVAVAHRGANAHITTQYASATNSLSAAFAVLSPSTSASFDTAAPEGYFGKPDLFENDLHTGDVTDTISLDVPQGPGGLTPPLNLAYNSGAVSSTHNVQAAAPWVGDGWNLDLGAITWSETNGTSCPGCTATWEDSWQLSDPFGTSSELIPPNTKVATYYDDTPNGPATSPVFWHSAPETHAKIISFINPNTGTDGIQTYFPKSSYSVQPPCFRVWLPSGIMEEFGCTLDSLQWYEGSPSGTTNYISAWKLDLITDPSGNQIQIHYDEDWSTYNGVKYPRDSVISSIQWDSPACHNANTACTGSSWAPLYQVTFAHSDVVAHDYTSGSACSAPINGIRCDDPQQEPSGNISTPELTQTQVLNDVSVQVRTSGTGSWNTLRSYRFWYDQAALNPYDIYDPVTGELESVAGYLLLRKFQELGTDGSTGYPAQVFTYTVPTSQYYEDSYYSAAKPTGDSDPCGPNWNTGKLANGTAPKGCLLWSRSYNGYYITEVDNGQGLTQTFT
jgi:hypothetical protein